MSTPMPTAEDLISAALRYAERNWRVFPVNGKTPLAGSRGFKDASNSSTILQAMRWREATGVGIATGQGLFVIDCDPRNGADATMAALISQHGPLPATATVQTGGGGTHYYFRTPTDLSIGGRSNNALGLGVDVKAEGGYVVAPPSRHPNGGQYSWSIDDTLASVPDWVLELLDRQHQAAKQAKDPGIVAALIAEGERNTCLTSLAGSMRRRGMGEESIRVALLSENSLRCFPPLPESEVSSIAASVAKYSPDQNNTVTVGSEKERPEADAPIAEHLTEFGNALRLVRLRGGDLRYVHLWSKWLRWDGRRWRILVGAEIHREFDAVLHELIETQSTLQQKSAALAADLAGTDAATIVVTTGDPEIDAKVEKRAKLTKQADAFGKWAHKSESRRSIEAAVALARSRPQVSIEPDALDRDPFALTVANGTINLRNGQLQMHRRSDLLTRFCDVAFSPTAKAPTWEKFLFEIMDGKAQLVDYLKRVLGYSITGDVREQSLFFLHGQGANGKSTLLSVVRKTLGKDLSCEAAPDLLLTKRGESHPTDRAFLFGKRFVTTIEVEEGKRLAEALVKQLTGGDEITARRMREDFWGFDPTFKLFLAANHRPAIVGTDDAIWRRIHLIPFTVSFLDRADKDLSTKLLAERQGILNWLVQGCLAWQEAGGLAPPDEVLAATKEYREESDVLGRFISEACIVGSNFKVKAGELFDTFAAWHAAEIGGDLPTKKSLGLRMTALGYTPLKGTAGTRWWAGLGLKTEGDSKSGEEN